MRLQEEPGTKVYLLDRDQILPPLLPHNKESIPSSAGIIHADLRDFEQIQRSPKLRAIPISFITWRPLGWGIPFSPSKMR